MEQTIKLREIYVADLFTRSRANELRSRIDKRAKKVILDFDQIGFMSRSFADELCNIMDENNNVSFCFINCSNDIDSMINKVKNSRSIERKRGVGNAKIYKFDSIESLSKYFLSMT